MLLYGNAYCRLHDFQITLGHMASNGPADVESDNNELVQCMLHENGT